MLVYPMKMNCQEQRR